MARKKTPRPIPDAEMTAEELAIFGPTPPPLEDIGSYSLSESRMEALLKEMDPLLARRQVADRLRDLADHAPASLDDARPWEMHVAPPPPDEPA